MCVMMNDRTQSRNTVEKQAAAVSAVSLVCDGMVVGIGTGSTAAYAVSELGKLVVGGLDIVGVPTSYQSEMLALRKKIPISTLLEYPVIDIVLDGADQISRDLVAIKGGGAAHAKEKVVAHAAKRVVLMVDEVKLVPVLMHVVPIEVLPCAVAVVDGDVRAMGGVPSLRMAARKDGPVVTDNGNFVVDADFGEIVDPVRLNDEINAMIGVVEHGIFLNVDEVHVGTVGGAKILKK